MNEEVIRSDRCHVIYPDKGVEIVIPPQKGYEKVVVEEIITKKYEWEDWVSLVNPEDEFKPHREAINFKVKFHSDDGPQLNFDPPIMLKVKFTYDDLNWAAEKQSELNLGFLPKESPFWVKFAGDKYQLERFDDKDYWWDLSPHGDEWAGYYVVKITEWGDPSVSVGR